MDPTSRFSDRVEHYLRSRPDYPPAFYEFLRSDLGLTPAWAVADVGFGGAHASTSNRARTCAGVSSTHPRECVSWFTEQALSSIAAAAKSGTTMLMAPS